MVVATNLMTQQKQVPHLLRTASWEGHPQPASLSLGLPLLGRCRGTSDFKVRCRNTLSASLIQQETCTNEEIIPDRCSPAASVIKILYTNLKTILGSVITPIKGLWTMWPVAKLLLQWSRTESVVS